MTDKENSRKRICRLWLTMSAAWPAGYFLSAFLRSIVGKVSFEAAFRAGMESFILNGIPTFCVFTVIFIALVRWLGKD
ncbi:hypothetical protein [Arcanobacterium haemolyticum]|uniref:Uncharacterized protein n=1 Tax=Arcanobacterium haemolyticum (strain ATCC 9345 / DSM 20595 / CCM 5947 / CCUG 17215 / LMG 16163 / NBRC 15585 / NCTC 8452 / 11018) TaxID=644284 RepID=D7BM46_ARCHD|nr:hypothetical protein [Arcanobacterium haemolyticum]ADH91995.1 hypothetical protein Arch_0234 [Arcanobacterium haemolyticum DSM 20595]SPT74749.1 Uncharacterised protein [Arcanobacterium haemolyticum]SQH29303.1 Uncharacterised protein [Arcanobacterium haemolyticum]